MMSRAEAHAAGQRFYTAEKPCLNGHTAKRYVTTGGCTECLKKYRVTKPQRVIVPPHLQQAFEQMCKAMGVTVLDGSPVTLSKAPLHNPAQRVVSPLQHLIDQLPNAPRPTAR